MRSRIALAALVLGSLAAPAQAVELASASYRILGSNLNGGGHPATLAPDIEQVCAAATAP